jgi:hypothetical protein
VTVWDRRLLWRFPLSRRNTKAIQAGQIGQKFQSQAIFRQKSFRMHESFGQNYFKMHEHSFHTQEVAGSNPASRKDLRGDCNKQNVTNALSTLVFGIVIGALFVASMSFPLFFATLPNLLELLAEPI